MQDQKAQKVLKVLKVQKGRKVQASTSQRLMPWLHVLSFSKLWPRLGLI